MPELGRLEAMVAEEVHEAQVVAGRDAELLEGALVAAAGLRQRRRQHRLHFAPVEIAREKRLADIVPEVADRFGRASRRRRDGGVQHFAELHTASGVLERLGDVARLNDAALALVKAGLDDGAHFTNVAGPG